MGILTEITHFLFGRSRLLFSGSPSAVAAFLTLLLRSGIEYTGLSRTEQGVAFTLAFGDEKKVRKLWQSHEDGEGELTLLSRQGLPALVWRYRFRPGVFLGLALFFFLLLFSQKFVFDIRISGNETLSDSSVLQMLEEDGFSVGTYLPSVDLTAFCSNFVLHHGEVGWISVNMMGTVAEVEVREYDAKGENASQGQSASSVKALVAKQDGVVQRYEVYAGTLLVESGQVVEKGQLLISCVTQTENRFHISNAEGAVYASVSHTFEVFVPFEEEVTEEICGERLGWQLEAFGKIRNFSSKGSIFPPTCDTIEKRERLLLFDRIPLPVYRTVYYRKDSKTTVVRRGEEEASAEALARMTALLQEELSESEVLQLSRTEEVEESGVRLTYTLRCLENIAVPIELENHLMNLDSGSAS